MKKIRYIAIAFLLTLSVAGTINAQIDRSKAPLPGPAPKINLGAYESVTLNNGLKVFVIENHKLPRVSYQLLVNYDPILEADKAGYVEMAGLMLRAGTQTKTKVQIDKAIDFIGGTLKTSPTGIYATSLKKHNEVLLSLMSEVLLEPTFPVKELEKMKTKKIAELELEQNDAGSIAKLAGNALSYGKMHPYGEMTTEESVKKITVETCKKFYNHYFKPNISYLVIVGDITLEEAKPLVMKHFGGWEKGAVKEAVYPTPKGPDTSYIAFVNRPEAVQSVINIIYPVALKPGSEDIIPASVMNNLLGGGVFQGRLMQNLREDKAYTYGARSDLHADALVGHFKAYASVRNEVTDSALEQFFFELRRLITEDVSEADLSLAKNQLSGSFALSLEHPGTVAGFAIDIERYGLQKDYYANYLKKLDKVSVADVRRMAEKYIRPDKAIVFVVGSKNACAEKLERFGKVRFFDIYGNELKEETIPVPEGMTGRKVVDKYLTTCYGTADIKTLRKQLKKRKGMVTTMEASVAGQNLSFIKKDLYPYYSLSTVSAGEQIFQKMWFNGKEAGASGMMGEQKFEGDEFIQKQNEAMLDLEARYEERGYTLDLLGIEKIDQKECYKVKITAPDDKAQTHYFEVATGYRMRFVRNETTPQGPVSIIIDLSDYKDVGGMKVPHTIHQDSGLQKINLKVIKVETGVKLKKGDFS